MGVGKMGRGEREMGEGKWTGRGQEGQEGQERR